EVKVDKDGNWMFTPNPPLNDGKHDLTLIVTDPVGNSSEESAPYSVIVDTVAPGKPVITAMVDDQGAVKGPITAGTITDDAQPHINGTAEPGSSVIIYDKGVEIGRAPVDARGNWTFLPSPPLSNGPHKVSVAAMDAAGNLGDKSAAFDFEVIAGGAPTAPAITGIIDDVGSKLGNLSPGNVTDDARPAINGTGGVGATIFVYANGKLLGTTEVQANGQWSFVPTADLVDGLNNITATTTNAAGNVSPPTGQYSITVDTLAPGSATGQVLSDDVGAITGPINSGGTTDDSTPTFSGTAEAGTTVIIYDKGVEIDRVPVNAQGQWRFTPSTPLADGPHSLNTVIEDAAGHQSPKSTPIDFSVDTRAVAISITQVTDNVGTVQGPLSQGGVTDDTTPTLNGKATANATVNLYDGSVKIGSTTSDASGNWTLTPSTALGQGNHRFTATVTTPAGGESVPTPVFNLEIDITPPVNPGEGGTGGIDNVHDDVGSNQGPIDNGGFTDDTTPTLSGGGQQPGDTVSIYDDGALIGTAQVGADGNWSFTPDPPLNEGEHEFTMVVTDPAGNASDPSDPYIVTVDFSAPAAQATIVSMGKDSGSDSGDFLTNDGTAGRLIQGSLTAALSADEKVQVSVDGGVNWQDALLNGDGTWSFVDETVHASDWEIQTRVIDVAGNVGGGNVQQVMLDNTPPDAPASVSRSGDEVAVEVAGTTVNAGDVLIVNVGETQVRHTLTQQDIDTGTVAVDVPAVVTGTLESFIVDNAGNVSNITTAPRELRDDFSSLDPGYSINAGESSRFDFYTLTNLYGSSISWLDHNRRKALIIGQTHSGANITLDFPATSFSFEVTGTNGGANNTIYYKDIEGNVIHSESANSPGTYSFTPPDGIYIGTVEITVSDIAGICIDNIEVITASGALTHPTNQLIDNAIGYFGSDDNNLFTIDSVNNLSGTNSGVHGGAGLDTLTLSGKDQVLDLTSIGEKLNSIEVIDLTGSGDNTLKLSLEDVLSNGETDLFHTSGKTQMMVKGDAGDKVDLQGLISAEDPGSWSNQGQITVGGLAYQVYNHSSLDAELLVQQGVTTNLV
ncbi:Ig-like domain-containing protein, partial [Pseudomonas sp. NPDC087346]|uniref:Ig-like domain-containing protein n=1 Tax=Pseudomonas sp. NPDC087346 TaxID=3364438 RepID=UPI00381C2780